MRRLSKASARRVVILSLMMLMVTSLVAPAIAAALTPYPTINLATLYQSTATSLKFGGSVGTAFAGRQVTMEVRKPGRPYWSTVGWLKVGADGRYIGYYTPKLAGKFYFRIRMNYGGADYLSRIATLLVGRGPGVKYQISLASTTSTRDSGLFEALMPAFFHDCPEYTMKAAFVGSGAAIALGGSGDADVLLTHSPAAERDFMRGIVAGRTSAYRGKSRYKVMYNDFVLIGPKTNPAGIVVTDPATTAFHKVAAARSTFWSRNDKSGTNVKEKEIWAAIGNPQILTPGTPPVYQSWYKASGVMGMAQALSAANQGLGYTLADRATWLNWKSMQPSTSLKLTIANQGDKKYFNQYSVIEVNGARNWEGAQDFSQWIRTPRAQDIIRAYGVYTYGQAMFFPNAGSYLPGQ